MAYNHLETMDIRITVYGALKSKKDGIEPLVINHPMQLKEEAREVPTFMKSATQGYEKAMMLWVISFERARQRSQISIYPTRI